jgi:diphthamide biosynthesis methyltransferase
MTIHEAVDLLENMSEKSGFSIPLYVGIARAGSESPVVAAGDARRLKDIDFGPPLHILIVPAALHVMEREYLEMFAGL